MHFTTLRRFGIFLLVAFAITRSSAWRRRRRRDPIPPPDPPKPCSGSGVPSAPPHATVSTTDSYNHGSVATFTCNRDYKIGTGDGEMKCNDGTWTGKKPTCVLGCVTPRSPLNGTVLISEASAIYSCRAGFRLVGANRRRCIVPNWTGSAPECEKYVLVSVSHGLSNPLYGSVTVSNNRATYSCFTHYKIVGAAVRLCSNGAWVGVAPTCVLECGNLDAPANGRVTITGNTAHYECNSKYRLKGDAVRVCANKRWASSSPVCSKVCSTNLDSPVHGSLSVSEDKTTYSCFSNYKIVGTAIRHCSNGEWLGDTPTCVLACRQLESPANGISTIVGNTAHYKCDANYSIEGDTVRTCQNNIWTGIAPVCTKRCKDFSPPSNGFVSFDGQKATFSCRPRYQLIGNRDTTCVNGQWSKSAPSCVLECGIPFKPLNGTVTLRGFTAYFQCNQYHGYNLVGDSVRVCNDDGIWSGRQPECQKDCPPMDDPDYGFATVSGRIANFVCYQHYDLRGTKQMTCNSQGIWIGTKPRCVLSCFLFPLLNGKYTLYGIAVVNTCNSGYVLHGATLRLCARGEWSGNQPVCLPSDILITS